MSGDDLRHIQPDGDLNLTRGRHNAFVDAARAHRDRQSGSGRARRGQGVHSGVMSAYNTEASQAPLGAIVEVSATGATGAQVEFGQPGHAGGVHRYGVALEPVVSGGIGFIAMAGGPWPVRCSVSPSRGDTIGASSGSWGGVLNAGDLLVLRGVIDGYALCVFTNDFPGAYEVSSVDTGAETCVVKRYVDSTTLGSLAWTCNYDSEPSTGDIGLVSRQGDGALLFSPGGGGGAGAPRMLAAKADMTTDDSEYNCKCLDSDGTEGDTVKCKRPNGIEVATDDVGFLGSDTDGDNIFIPVQGGVIYESQQTQDFVIDVNWDSTNTKIEQTKKQVTIGVFGRVTAIGSASTTTVDDADPCP